MRTLIFATNEESHDIWNTLGGKIFCNRSASYPNVVPALLDYLHEHEDAVAIVTEDIPLEGWCTNHPTHVMFSTNYPKDPHTREQARSRVRLSDPFRKITQIDILRQLEKDRNAFKALPQDIRDGLARDIKIMRQSSRSNFSDPEPL